MNSKRPKIWKTEDEIIAAIDRTKRMAERKLKKSQELAEVAKVKNGRVEKLLFELMAVKSDEGTLREKIEQRLRDAEMSAGKARETADIYAAAYHRAINSTLPRLGEILAAFRTQTMEGVMGTYRGVAIR